MSLAEREVAGTWPGVASTLVDVESLLLERLTEDGEIARTNAGVYLAGVLGVGLRLCLESSDPLLPRFVRWDEPPILHWGSNCPDCLWSYARIDPALTYRIHGNRGSACHLDVQIRNGLLPIGPRDTNRTLSTASLFDLEVGDGGQFELTVAPDRIGDGNWLASGGDAGFVLIRQYFGDWATEMPADLQIECLDVQLPRPPVTADDLGSRLSLLRTWLHHADQWGSGIDGARYLNAPANRMEFQASPDESRGVHGQLYGSARVSCAPDGAVLVDFLPPPSKYWSFALYDTHGAPIDYTRRQSSLNMAQAKLDGDGHFRCVISHADPGVENWLDPGGLSETRLFLRCLRPAGDVGVPTLKSVSARAVGEICSGWPTVSAAERHDRLRARASDVQRRVRC